MYLVHSKHSKSPFKQNKFNSATRRWTHSTYAKRVMSLTILHLCSNFLLHYLPNFISVWQYSSKWKCLTSSIMAKPSNISSLQSSKGSLNASLVIPKLMALWHKWHCVGFKSSTNFFSAFNDFVHTSGICHKSLKNIRMRWQEQSKCCVWRSDGGSNIHFQNATCCRYKFGNNVRLFRKKNLSVIE